MKLVKRAQNHRNFFQLCIGIIDFSNYLTHRHLKKKKKIIPIGKSSQALKTTNSPILAVKISKV